MSELVTLATEIEFKNVDVLKEAIKEIEGAEVKTSYQDYYGKQYNCEVALHHNSIPHGIGFQKVKDVYKPIADTYRQQSSVNDMLKELEHKYVSALTKKALRKHGFRLKQVTATRQRVEVYSEK